MPRALLLFVCLSLKMSGWQIASQNSASIPIDVDTAMRPVAGLPYSADEVWQNLTNLPNGKTFKWETTNRVLRDTAGRTRNEMPLPYKNFHVSPPFVLITIQDPIVGYRYTIDDRKRLVHRDRFRVLTDFPISQRSAETRNKVRAAWGPGGFSIPVPPGTIPVDENNAHLPAADQNFVSEGLGTKLIDGTLAEGVQYTTRLKGVAGDHPFMTTESWTDPSFKLELLSVVSNPHIQTTRRLTNINRSEPPPELFQVPAEYSMIVETTAYTITYPLQ